jgi:hypothetical protein
LQAALLNFQVAFENCLEEIYKIVVMSAINLEPYRVLFNLSFNKLYLKTRDLVKPKLHIKFVRPIPHFELNSVLGQNCF